MPPGWPFLAVKEVSRSPGSWPMDDCSLGGGPLLWKLPPIENPVRCAAVPGAMNEAERLESWDLDSLRRSLLGI